MDRHPHVLNASSNLLGICFVIITGLHITKMSARTYGDEIAWVAALLFLISIWVAFSAIRNNGSRQWQTVASDWVFMLGVVALTASTLTVAYGMN